MRLLQVANAQALTTFVEGKLGVSFERKWWFEPETVERALAGKAALQAYAFQAGHDVAVWLALSESDGWYMVRAFSMGEAKIELPLKGLHYLASPGAQWWHWWEPDSEKREQNRSQKRAQQRFSTNQIVQVGIDGGFTLGKVLTTDSDGRALEVVLSDGREVYVGAFGEGSQGAARTVSPLYERDLAVAKAWEEQRSWPSYGHITGWLMAEERRLQKLAGTYVKSYWSPAARKKRRIERESLSGTPPKVV